MDPRKIERAFARAKRVPGVRTPASFQLGTERLLVPRQVDLWERGLEAALAVLPTGTRDSSVWVDASQVAIRKAVNQVFRRYSGLTTLAQKLKKQYERGDTFHRAQFLSTINRAIGVSVADLLEDRAAIKTVAERLTASVDLIKTLDFDLKNQLQQEIWEGVLSGRDSVDIKKMILERSNVPAWRARLIARDQSSKLFSSLSRVRQEDLGVEEYDWESVGDNAVRTLHTLLEEQSPHRWDAPTTEGFPGDPVQCRCVAGPRLRTAKLLK